jgi:hypothetical protein
MRFFEFRVPCLLGEDRREVARASLSSRSRGNSGEKRGPESGGQGRGGETGEAERWYQSGRYVDETVIIDHKHFKFWDQPDA